MSYISTLAPLALLVAVAALQSPEANEAYQEGRAAVEDKKWKEAIEAFEQVLDDQTLGDAALYWQAYAFSKLPDRNRALELVAQLERQFPDSTWRDDAQVLAAEIRGGRPGAGSPSDDEELKLMALNGLMQADEESAIPILEEFLTSEKSPRLRERALFVLAQSDSEKAHAILAKVAKGDADPELQQEAIRYLGVHGSDRGLALLAELYSSLKSTEARAAVLQSFMIAGEEKRLLDLAQNEPDRELRGRAIQLLGAMDAGEELWRLFGSERDIEIKKEILQGLFIAGQHERIAEVARDKAQPAEIRKAAVRSLGVSGDEAVPALVALYRAETDRELKEDVLEGLFVSDAVKELIEIARAETDPELKKRAVEKISIMGSKEAKDFLMEILRKK
jgi:HEAT repeat protein